MENDLPLNNPWLEEEDASTKEFNEQLKRFSIAEKMGYKFISLDDFLKQEEANPEKFKQPNLPNIPSPITTRTTEYADVKITCPKCGIGKLILFNGKFGSFWGCNAFNQNGCKFKKNVSNG